MRNLLLAACALILSVHLNAADPKYPVSAIPENLKKEVNAVIREQKISYKIISMGKGEMVSRFVVTIFNEKGNDLAQHALFYDKLSKIKKINAAVYDAAGNAIKKLKNNEIIDHSAFDGFSLYSDTRLKYIELSQSAYPYTVELEYEKDYNFLFSIEDGDPIPDEKVAVQYFSYQLIYPSALAPRYKTYNLPVNPVKGKNEDGLETLTWELANLAPLRDEPFSPSSALYPRIQTAPSAFEFDGYKGNMSSWNEFGKWIKTLNAGRTVLPEATKERVKQLVSKATTDEEKVKILYEYLQSKTRYVSIQLGIGGYQPFEAKVVDETGYGDCKALSNYMIAMLETAGIKANYVLIQAGAAPDELDESFPSSQFNHAIVAVPNKNDTLWLECTSQTNPFGYQGKFTGDRKALMITDDGARVVRTTRYPAEQNVQSRTAEVFIEPTGDAKARVRTTYAGLQYENQGLDNILASQHDDQKKWIQENTDIPSFDLKSFSLANKKGKIPSAEVNLDLAMRKYATVSGKRLFLMANIMNRMDFIPEKVEGRKTDVVKRIGYVDIDTIKFNIPESVYPEFLPETIKHQSRFGEYECSFKLDQGKLVYVRRLKMNKGQFPAASYPELVDFYKNVTRADNTKVVFLSKT